MAENKQDTSEDETKKLEKLADEAKSDNQDSDKQPTEETSTMNPLEATGVAVFKNVDESAINRPGKGEVKRSYRLLRLLLVMTLTLLSFLVAIGFLAHPMAGLLKLLGMLVFLAFTTRCAYVSFKLWKNLK